MRQGRRWLGGVLVVVVLAGCQGGGKAETGGGAQPAPTATAATTTQAPTTTAATAQPPTQPPTAQPPAKPPAALPIPAARLGQASAPVTPSGQTAPMLLQGLQLDVPTEWQPTPASAMRLAQMDIPGAGGFAELAVFRFPGGAGSVDQNIQRWVGQFITPEGAPPTPDTQSLDLDGLKVTTVRLSGTYVAPITPRDPSRRYNEPGWAMVCFIVEGVGDPYFFKVVGPAATLAAWQPALEALARSFKVAA